MLSPLMVSTVWELLPSRPISGKWVLPPSASLGRTTFSLWRCCCCWVQRISSSPGCCCCSPAQRYQQVGTDSAAHTSVFQHRVGADVVAQHSAYHRQEGTAAAVQQRVSRAAKISGISAHISNPWMAPASGLMLNITGRIGDPPHSRWRDYSRRERQLHWHSLFLLGRD
ncbi:uncharacterized protein M6B38_176640 [Iris pallida]|uniref:Uncharacterized protein n=1 Tax=Iris pallida TaxID=29817 RepID=A0AAX6EQ89_IRIPA|nr:uncharacterized protein M6B38_176640 [Iris pallida]